MDILEIDLHYRTSPTGEVKRRKTGRVLKHQICRSGYHRVGICINGKRKMYSVHRLVAMRYLPVRNIDMEINHIDGDKSNNKVSNLEWVTHKENMAHAKNKLKRKMGKITNHKRNEMIKYLCKNYSNKDIAMLLKTTSENISRIKKPH